MTQRTYERITTGPEGPRRPIDYEARKYFVYTLSDADGVPVYVGRSNNVAARIRAHFSAAICSPRGDEDTAFMASWVRDVRSVSMVGPFVWDEVVAEERRQIKAKMPRGNRCGVPKFVTP
jgi:hypothetical protein